MNYEWWFAKVTPVKDGIAGRNEINYLYQAKGLEGALVKLARRLHLMKIHVHSVRVQSLIHYLAHMVILPECIIMDNAGDE